jgi:hypothetical protein
MCTCRDSDLIGDVWTVLVKIDGENPRYFSATLDKGIIDFSALTDIKEMFGFEQRDYMTA